MDKKISLVARIIIIYLFSYTANFAAETVIIPLKKPILDKITKQKKLTQGIIKPKSKPIKEVKEQKLSNEF